MSGESINTTRLCSTQYWTLIATVREFSPPGVSHTQLQREQYTCKVCGRKFVANKGTVFYRRRLPRETISRIVTLLSHGCPRQAIAAAFDVNERTVNGLGEAARGNCRQVHEHLVERPNDH